MFTVKKLISACICLLLTTLHLGCTNVTCSPPVLDKSSASTPPLQQKNERHTYEQNLIWDVSNVCIDNVDSTRKLIAFTFDDAPAKTLESIVSVFAAFNESNPDCPATATVFCNGHRITANGMQLLKAAHLIGFEMGNHSYSHTDLTVLTNEQLQSEIMRTDKLLRTVDGKATHLFRAPFGNVNENLRAVVHTPIISWTIDTLDWTQINENHIYDTIIDHLFNGAIVLMHDGYEDTVYALKRLLPDLKARGYQVVSVSQMAKIHRQNLERGKVYIRVRKNGNG